MEVKDYLIDELKRLKSRNDVLEEETNKSQFPNLEIEEVITKNTLAMCEIAKALLCITYA